MPPPGAWATAGACRCGRYGRAVATVVILTLAGKVSVTEEDHVRTHHPHRPEATQDKRGIWRIGAADIEDFIAEAYRRTAERVASGEIKDEGEAGAE